jgi:predicted SnoaL-like aldol condensation-catalyzing enzyme
MADSNKDAAISFLKLAASGKVREAYSKFVDAGFRHHNPLFEGSAEALMAGMEENARQNPSRVLEVKRAVAEGEFVVVHSHVRHKRGDLGVAVVHISHYFETIGNLFEYVWEVSDDTLTIWGGYVGSPAHFKGKFSADGNSNTGRWEWPGGGYESTMTRVKAN